MEDLLGILMPGGFTRTKRPTCTAVPVPSGQPPVLPKGIADGIATPLVDPDVRAAPIRSGALRTQPLEFRSPGFALDETRRYWGRGMLRRQMPLRAGYS